MDEIRELMEKYKISLRHIARASGYSKTYTYRCLTGVQVPSESFLEDVSDALKEITEFTRFNQKEMEIIKVYLTKERGFIPGNVDHSSMTDREWKEFLEKLQ